MDVALVEQGSSIVATDAAPGQPTPVANFRVVVAPNSLKKFHRGPFVSNDPSQRIPDPTVRLPETSDPEEHLWKPPPWSITDVDGRIVEGYASMPNLDDQGDIVPLSVIDSALPSYMEWANLREMHGKNAAGKVLSAWVKDGGVYIKARVDDDAAWNKVKAGVYQGFSIGGDITDIEHKDGARIIQGMRLNEISLVDRPANRRAKITVIKLQKHFTGKQHFINEVEKTIVILKGAAQSEAQRRWAFGVKGKEWAQEHGFDNKGKLPAHAARKIITVALKNKCEAMLNKIVIAKYSDDEPRDDKGKWTTGGSGSGTATADKPRPLGHNFEGSVHYETGADKHLRIAEVRTRTWRTPDGQHHIRTSVDGAVARQSMTGTTFPDKDTARSAALRDFQSTIREFVGRHDNTREVRVGVKRYPVEDYHNALRDYRGSHNPFIKDSEAETLQKTSKKTTAPQ
jgi:hypothetical protein